MVGYDGAAESSKNITHQREKNTLTAASKASTNESAIQLISDYVVFLLGESVSSFNVDSPELDADIKLVTNLDKAEDLLVYLCLIAHTISNNEDMNDVCEDKPETVRMHTATIVLVFLSLLS